MRNGLRRAWRVVVALTVLALPTLAHANDPGTLRIGVLQFGTVSWELDVIKAHGLDRAEGFTLEVQPFGNNDAADVALLGRAVDGIVEDWLWVARQRADDLPVVWIPYSSAAGMLMGREGMDGFGSLEGKRVGVAGGPLDKSWLLMQAMARETEGIDLATSVEPAFGAPPLLTEKFRTGELDAILNYWNYGARLEAEGFVQVASVGEAQEVLGVPADTPQLGYVFHEDFADENAELVEAFARASRAAKALMAESEAEWERLRPLMRVDDGAAFEALKRRYRDGIVHSWGEAERAAAARLFAILAELGGEPLVGKAETLPPGTFWTNVRF